MKLAVVYLAKAFLVIVVMTSVLVMALFAVNKIKSESDAAAGIVTGVVVPEGDKAVAALVKFANGISSLQDYCRLEVFDYNDAMEGLLDGALDMVIVIPDDFFDAATQMEPAEFTLYVSGEKSVGEKKLIGMLQGVEKVMVNTEGGICSMYKGMSIVSFPVTKTQMEDEMMEIFVRQFLNRGKLFDIHSLSPFGEYNLIQYYFIGISILIWFVCGVAYLGLYGKCNRRLERILARSLAQRVIVCIEKIVSMSVPMGLLLSFFTMVINSLMDYMGSNLFIARPYSYVTIWIFAFSAAIWIQLAGALSVDSAHGRTIYFIVVLVFAAVSGIIAPAVYLPSVLRTVSGIIPFSFMHRMLLDGMWGEMNLENLIIILVLDLIVAVIGMLLYNRRLAVRE